MRQRIPGSVTKTSALDTPQGAAPINVVNDWQRNLDTIRLANKTTVRLDDTTIDFGVFGVDRHLMHPIFQWLDYRYQDYGGYTRVTDDRNIGGFRNVLVAGVNVINGAIDAQQFVNTGGLKGTPTSSLSAETRKLFGLCGKFVLLSFRKWRSWRERNTSQRCATGSLNFSTNGDVSGRSTFSLWSPKVGLLWNIDPTWQAFQQYLAQRRGAEFW